MTRVGKARRVAFQQQKGRCFWCGTGLRDPTDKLAPRFIAVATGDHLVPKSLGGTERRENIVAACHNCNRKRGNQPVMEWLEVLKDRLKRMRREHHFEVVLSWLEARGMSPHQVGHPGNGPDPISPAASPPPMDTRPAP